MRRRSTWHSFGRSRPLRGLLAVASSSVLSHPLSWWFYVASQCLAQFSSLSSSSWSSYGLSSGLGTLMSYSCGRYGRIMVLRRFFGFWDMLDMSCSSSRMHLAWAFLSFAYTWCSMLCMLLGQPSLGTWLHVKLHQGWSPFCKQLGAVCRITHWLCTGWLALATLQRLGGSALLDLGMHALARFWGNPASRPDLTTSFSKVRTFCKRGRGGLWAYTVALH